MRKPIKYYLTFTSPTGLGMVYVESPEQAEKLASMAFNVPKSKATTYGLLTVYDDYTAEAVNKPTNSTVLGAFVVWSTAIKSTFRQDRRRQI